MIFNIFLDLCNHHSSHIYKNLPDLLESGIAEFSYSILMKSISTSVKCKNMDEFQKHCAK